MFDIATVTTALVLIAVLAWRQCRVAVDALVETRTADLRHQALRAGSGALGDAFEPAAVTLSVGLASGSRGSVEEPLANADDALYEAKSRGKNRYVARNVPGESDPRQVPADHHRPRRRRMRLGLQGDEQILVPRGVG